MTSAFPSFLDASLRIARARQAVSLPVSQAVISAITAYNEKLPLGQAAKANLKIVQSKPFAAVVTGQQVGVLGGPIMSVLKALTACKVAAELTKETGIATIPFFWLQCEDQDFSEIKTFNYLGKTGEITSLEIQQSSRPGTSLQFELINESIFPLLETFATEFGHGDDGAAISAVLCEAYQDGRCLPEAFAHFYAWLFESYGMLFFNPWEPTLKPKRQEIFSKAFLQSAEIEVLISQTETQPIFVRKNSPLFFYHPDGADTPRYRLERENDLLKMVGGDKTVSVAQLQMDLQSAPEKFSASALLRPIIQDSLLPTVAYVGGPAELAYFEQLSGLYRLFNLEKPFVLERVHAQLIDAKVSGWIAAMGLSAKDMQQSEAALIALLSKQGVLGDSQMQSVKLEIQRQLNSLKEPLIGADKTLGGALENATAKITYQLDGLATRYQKALAAKSETTANRLNKAQKALYPQDTPQERFYSIAPFLSLSGRSLLDKIYASIAPAELANHEFKDIAL